MGIRRRRRVFLGNGSGEHPECEFETVWVIRLRTGSVTCELERGSGKAGYLEGSVGDQTRGQVLEHFGQLPHVGARGDPGQPEQGREPQGPRRNSGTSGLYECVALDMSPTIEVADGATITMRMATNGTRTVSNHTGIVPADVPPAPAVFDGQFVQLDVIDIAAAHR